MLRLGLLFESEACPPRIAKGPDAGSSSIEAQTTPQHVKKGEQRESAMNDQHDMIVSNMMQHV